MSDLLLTTRHACDLLQCHPNSLRRWEKEGLITSIRIGKRGHRKYKKEALEKLMKKQHSQEVVMYSAEWPGTRPLYILRNNKTPSGQNMV